MSRFWTVQSLVVMVALNVAAGRLQFTTDIAQGLHHGRVVFIAVGTPPGEDGSADLQHVLAAARSIGRHMTTHKVVVNKSTVPVGTGDRVKAAVNAALQQRGLQVHALQVRRNGHQFGPVYQYIGRLQYRVGQ